MGPHLDDYSDYVLFYAERYAPGSPFGQLRHLVVWNEVTSAGWMDMSPRVPNRITHDNTTGDAQLTAADLATWTDTYADLIRRTAAAAMRHNKDALVWISTDHFWRSPVQRVGDVLHWSVQAMVDAVWDRIGTDVPWGVVVHPYDGGDPRQDVWAQGIYTFATLQHIVDYQVCR